MNVKTEIERLTKLFENADEEKLALLEGHIIENAQLRCQLADLNKIALKSGLIKVHPTNPQMQKETPVCKALAKVRSSYVNSSKLLIRELGAKEEDFDSDMEDFL